jgi:hypothetical protein
MIGFGFLYGSETGNGNAYLAHWMPASCPMKPRLPETQISQGLSLGCAVKIFQGRDCQLISIFSS